MCVTMKVLEGSECFLYTCTYTLCFVLRSDSECDDVDPVVEVALHISKEDGQVGNLEPK